MLNDRIALRVDLVPKYGRLGTAASGRERDNDGSGCSVLPTCRRGPRRRLLSAMSPVEDRLVAAAPPTGRPHRRLWR